MTASEFVAKFLLFGRFNKCYLINVIDDSQKKKKKMLLIYRYYVVMFCQLFG